ncbi:MAG: DUF1836 domain-containing protein [Clostridia bacterium]|nr:DUF1836 domain-containing protein [Clostridia bacterium]
MDEKRMEELTREAVRDANLRPEEIPAIDLYVDQITSLMGEKLKEGAARFEDRVLTKTMINNYSKDGLISPVKGKKYNKEQILQMLLVYELKNTLSIGEIKRLLQSFYALPDYSGGKLEEAYVRFLGIKEQERREMPETVASFVSEHGIDPTDESEFLTLILGLSTLSSYLKNTVQALLDEHEEAKLRAEQEKKDAAKRKKEEKKTAAKIAKLEAAMLEVTKADAAKTEAKSEQGAESDLPETPAEEEV